jgi:hypothetical protein
VERTAGALGCHVLKPSTSCGELQEARKAKHNKRDSGEAVVSPWRANA